MQTNSSVSWRALWVIALPIAAQNLLTVILNVVDGIMIGQLGDAAISGVYVAGQIQMLLQVILGAIEGVVLLLCAQHFGNGNTDRVRAFSMLGAVCSFALGTLVALVCLTLPSRVLSCFSDEAAVIGAGTEYLRVLCLSFPLFGLSHALIAAMRSVGSARIGLYASAAALAVNLSLNSILIGGAFGLPALGVQGAAIATMVSRAVECAVMMIYVFVRDKTLSMRCGDVRHITRDDIRAAVRYGAPVFAGQVIWGVNLLVGTAILGRFDTAVTAAVGITNTAHHICYVGISGVASAVGIRIGESIGSGNEENVRRLCTLAQRTAICLGGATAFVLFLFRGPLVALYGVSAEAADEAMRLLAVLAISVVFTSYQSIGCFGLLRGAGAVDFLCLLDAVAVLLVVLPCAGAAFRLGAEAVIVFAFLKIDQVFKCPVVAYKLRSGSWINNVTNEGHRVVRAPSA